MAESLTPWQGNALVTWKWEIINASALIPLSASASLSCSVAISLGLVMRSHI
jgi:hypothetical protein